MEWEGHGSNTVGQIVPLLKDNKMIAKGYLYQLVRVNDLNQEVPCIDSVSIVNEFPESTIYLTNSKVQVSFPI